LYEYCKLSVAAVSEGERREEEGGGRREGEKEESSSAMSQLTVDRRRRVSSAIDPDVDQIQVLYVLCSTTYSRVSDTQDGVIMILDPATDGLCGHVVQLLTYCNS